jgi:hypothetical protein
MKTKIINQVPRIAMFIGETSYLTPFIGSLYAALQSTGEQYTYADLLGFSGAGNRLSWRSGTWDPGNVDITRCEYPPFSPHQRVFNAIGRQGLVRQTKSLWNQEEELICLPQATQEIVESIQNDVPVLAMGIIGPPECCVVFGYENSGESLIGWNYFQDTEGYDPNQPFHKKNWFPQLSGYILISEKNKKPNPKESALTAFRSIVHHFYNHEVKGSKVGLEAWKAMLHQLEHDDFSQCSLDFPNGQPGDDATWQNSVKGRFMVYCDALCQIYERHNVLPYYRSLLLSNPEWTPYLEPAIKAWEDCSSYGGYLWQYMDMSSDGLEKFRNPAIRQILAKEGRRCMEKDIEAISWIEKLLQKE